jgi:glutamate synthase domain-containing protein 1
MCGIVGLYLKNPALEGALGRLFVPMLAAMRDRGPDSAGVAVYRRPAPDGALKLTLFHPDETYGWQHLAAELARHVGGAVDTIVHANHAVLVVHGPEAAARRALAEHAPEVRLMSAGRRIEVFKDVGLPEEVAAKFGLADMVGSHAIGHTRMATESAVTTAGSHPFASGLDLCLVHNGSLSNYFRLRAWLRRHGVRIDTENDTEVAAGYLSYRLAQGDTLSAALAHGLRDLDGFYTFAVGTADGFAVLRDAFACKPAVLAETGDWVAMASEFRALADLPGVERARIWEPAPATVYAWDRSGASVIPLYAAAA